MSQLKVRHILCWDVPYKTPIEDEFPSLCKHVVLVSLKPFIHLYHQVNINLYLTEATALHHSKKSTGLKTILMYFQSPLAISLQ